MQGIKKITMSLSEAENSNALLERFPILKIEHTCSWKKMLSPKTNDKNPTGRKNTQGVCGHRVTITPGSSYMSGRQGAPGRGDWEGTVVLGW